MRVLRHIASRIRQLKVGGPSAASRLLSPGAVFALLTVLGGATASADEPASSAFDPAHQFIVVTFANAPLRSVGHAGTTGTHYSGGTYGLAQSASEEAKLIAATYSLRQVISWPIKELSVHCVVYEIPDTRTVDEVLAVLSKDSRVKLAQPLQQFRTLAAPPPPVSYNDPLYELQTNLVALDISAAHTHSQGAGVRVGLIDTGVDSKHPDLRDRIAHTSSFIPSPATNAAAYRHGTAMAGLIAAVANNNVGIVGIAPLARIEVYEACWQLKANTDDAVCNTFTLAKAIAAAIESHVPLVNLSLGGPADPLLSALVEEGLRRGVIFVGSTTDRADTFPANVRGVISVGGSEHEHTAAMLSAPATHVLTLRPGGQYDFESGTSVAAAEITGIVALLLAEKSRLTATTIVSLLKESAASAADRGNIDVSSALTVLEAQKSGGRLATTSTTR